MYHCYRRRRHKVPKGRSDEELPRRPLSLRASDMGIDQRRSLARQSEGFYDNPDIEFDDDPGQHVYAHVQSQQRREVIPEINEDVVLRNVDRHQEGAPPSSERHQFKHAAGLHGAAYSPNRPEIPDRPMLDNVGTLMTTAQDTQEAEDFRRMVSIMRENEEASTSRDPQNAERLVDTLKRERREAASGTSREFMEVDRSAQVSGRMFSDQSENERLLRRLTDEVDILKKTIHRLNSELARQVSPRSQTHSGNQLKLPGKGPVPAWLVNMKFMSPLLVAYDDKLDEKDAIIHNYDRQMREFEQSLNSVVKENERLHIKLEEAAGSGGPTSRSEWQQFLEQAKLVLEENQLLLEQLSVQEEKSKATNREHLAEVSRMSKQMIGLESQKDDLENEVFRLKQRFNDVKGRYDQLLCAKEFKEDDTTTEIYKTKKMMEELKTAQANETKELMKKLEAAQSDRRTTAEQLADATAERKKTEGEIKGLKKSLKEAHRKNLMLRKFLKKEESAQQYLDSVLNMAHSLAAERDNCMKMMKDKDTEYGRVIQSLVDEVRVKASIDANKKDYSQLSYGKERGRKAKTLSKLENIVRQLLEQNEDFRNKDKEYEREVIYLQSMVKEKEDLIDRVQTEKRHLEDQLETVWQAAVHDNKQLRAQLIDTL